MKNYKKIIVWGLCAAVLTVAAGCSFSKKLDVVAQESVTSFNALLTANIKKLANDDANYGFSLAAPDDSARFVWSKDFSQSPRYDVLIETDAQPFIDAGLDPAKLPDTVIYENDKIIVGANLGDDALKYNGEPVPLASYEHIVNLYRDNISYHAALDHYGVLLGNGNMFEWAKDMSTNDIDLVFVLNPGPFIAAGVDPNAVEGWVFGKVPVDVDGKPTEVDKLLKPFEIQ